MIKDENSTVIIGNTDPVKPHVIVRLHREDYPDLPDVEHIPGGDFVDLRSAKEVELKKGEFTYIDTGVSIKLPEGYWGQLVPRSSLYAKYGLIQTNSFGVIDESYCGDEDRWKLPVIALRDIVIPKNERICQFRIVKKQDFDIFNTEYPLKGPNRGGFGSTGGK